MLITKGYNTYECAEHYICDTELYLFSMLSQVYNIIIDCGFISTRHDRELVDGLNAHEKSFRLMATVQLPGSKGYGTHIVIHSKNKSYDAILSQ